MAAAAKGEGMRNPRMRQQRGPAPSDESRAENAPPGTMTGLLWRITANSAAHRQCSAQSRLPRKWRPLGGFGGGVKGWRGSSF